MATGKTVAIERSAWVVLKDYEQESCFILMFWVLAIIGFKGTRCFGAKKFAVTAAIVFGGWSTGVA